jgi:hypothetical protein
MVVFVQFGKGNIYLPRMRGDNNVIGNNAEILITYY